MDLGKGVFLFFSSTVDFLRKTRGGPKEVGTTT
jgi:hypothetical protein